MGATMTLPNSQPVIIDTDFTGLGARKKGKVRDIYDLGDALLLVATDRVSAFDVVLPNGIPGKGRVLTQLTRFWFNWFYTMEDICPSHMISTDVAAYPEACEPHHDTLEGRSMLVQKADPYPVECIVRGYLAGSGWKEYLKTGGIGGRKLPAGLKESDRLPEPIFTPSTKAPEGQHDVNIDDRAFESLVGKEMAADLKSVSLNIYTRAASYARERGIIIADTKFEFGADPKTGLMMWIDEALTPDSSRFWPLEDYEPGRGQPSFDKQIVRDYLLSTDWDQKPPAPKLPEAVIERTSRKYTEILERLTSGSR
jgi:phosphoribosylaminoimidazole-succinocarboxamide synthase